MEEAAGAVAVRIMLTTREAARQGFPVNVLFWGNIEAATTLIDRHLNTRFIIDHMAILPPRTPPAPPKPYLCGTDWTRAHAVVNYEQAVRRFGFRKRSKAPLPRRRARKPRCPEASSA
jgi:hypothetical protein